MSDKPKVVIGWCFPETVAGWFAYSLADLMLIDSHTGGYIEGFAAVSSGPRVAEARNTVIDEFAKGYPDADWLLFLDADMTFPANMLQIMMSVATPEETPILGGLCFTGGKHHEPHPTIFREVIGKTPEGDEVRGLERIDDYPKDSLVKVGATGAACLLVHRTVLATMKEHFGKLPSGRPSPYPWFAEGLVGPSGESWGEDVVFCMRATSLGIPVHVLTSIKLGHVKSHIIDETYFDQYWEARHQDELMAKATGDNDPYITRDEKIVKAAHVAGLNGNGNRAAKRKRARERVAGSHG